MYIEDMKIDLGDKIYKEPKNIDEIYKEDIKLGAMIETPSAVINFDEILKRSDFIAIGSNDLLQYIMVAEAVYSSQKIFFIYCLGKHLMPIFW